MDRIVKKAWRALWPMLLIAMVIGACTLAAVAQDSDANADLIADLGHIKDLNEKDPQLVRASFTDADGAVIEEEKLFVRWERVHKDQGNWIVLSAFCPHSKCKVIYCPDEGIYRDPCYGSEYSLDGRVKKGPSKKPLPDYSGQAFEEDGRLKLRRQASE